MKPTIAIVGRPNVGKSTLFNRLTRTRDALVADIPGLTRDRHYGHGKLGTKPYLVVDTGGFEPLAKDGIMHEMARQAEQAIAEADAIIFVVDGRVWWTSGTVTPAPERQSSITGGFKQTGPHDGVFATSGTSIPVTTPPTTHDPRLAVGCPVR